MLNSHNAGMKISPQEFKKLNRLSRLDCEIDAEFIERMNKLDALLSSLDDIILDNCPKLERLECVSTIDIDKEINTNQEYIKNKEGTFKSFFYVLPKRSDPKV